MRIVEAAKCAALYLSVAVLGFIAGLLLHGMSDGPYSLPALGQALERQGYRVLGLRMPGHGTAPAGLRTVTWEDMAAATRLGMAHLAEALDGEPVHIMGYSTGGTLAVDYSLSALAGVDSPVPASLVLISPAIGVTRMARLTRWFHWLSHLPGLEQLAWTSLVPEFDPFNYNAFSANASLQVHRMTRSVAERVRRLAAAEPIGDFPPTLILLTAVDATVSPDAVVDNLLKHLASGRHEMLLYDINRCALKSPSIVANTAPVVDRLMQDATLPFSISLVRNASPNSRQTVVDRKPAFATDAASSEPLDVPWPGDVISLSHVDLPFPPDDPLYGRYPPEVNGSYSLDNWLFAVNAAS